MRAGCPNAVLTTRRLGFLAFVILWRGLAEAADDPGHWYLNPCVGGITPDKPWGGTGSAVLYELDVGKNLSAAWSAEFAVNGAPLSDRFGPGQIGLYSGAINLLRVFNRSAAFAPYLLLGAGATHVAPPAGTGLENRTEFMVQPGLGAIATFWQSADGSRTLALRPDIKVRWTHGWAHAPGNPVDVLYVLGVTFSFGSARPPTPR
jgi:hypothetical protein